MSSSIAPAMAPSAMPLTLDVLGIGLWADGLGDWTSAVSAWSGVPVAPEAVRAKPQALLLPPAERRRAPATVAVAMDVADQACRMAGVPPSRLRSVFCSALGDMAITDYLCRTLAESPEHLSPIKFHHSVHNAASGYWTIGVGNHAASMAMAAGGETFAQGLLEAASQALCEDSPVLLVAYDMASPLPLDALTGSHLLAGVALVLAPPGEKETAQPALAQLCVSLVADPAPGTGPLMAPPLAHLMVPATPAPIANPQAPAWPLMQALARLSGPLAGNGAPANWSGSMRLTSGLRLQLALEGALHGPPQDSCGGG